MVSNHLPAPAWDTAENAQGWLRGRKRGPVSSTQVHLVDGWSGDVYRIEASSTAFTEYSRRADTVLGFSHVGFSHLPFATAG